MAKKQAPRQDPWRELARNQGTHQVNLDQVLSGFSVEDHSARALKKALIDRVAELTRAS